MASNYKVQMQDEQANVYFPHTMADVVFFTDGKSAAEGAARKSAARTATLTTAGWTGTAAPYTQTISVTGVTATSANEILPSLTITAAQLEAMQAANLQDGGQAAGKITVKAWGDKPAINLPIRVIVRGDL